MPPSAQPQALPVPDPFPGGLPGPHPEPPASDPDSDDESVVWRVVEDVVRRERRAVAGSRGATDTDGDVPAFRERYGGTVGVSLDDPDRAFAEADTRFELRFPEATCSAKSLLRVVSDRSAYRVTIQLVVTEGDRERWRRSWDVSMARDGQ